MCCLETRRHEVDEMLSTQSTYWAPTVAGAQAIAVADREEANGAAQPDWKIVIQDPAQFCAQDCADL